MNSVLVLGAGVSAPFNMPLGGDLIARISEVITNEEQRLLTDNPFTLNRRNQRLRAAQNTGSTFAEIAIHSTISEQYLTTDGREFVGKDMQEAFEKLLSLRDLLKGQTSETIDDFIVENPTYADLTKICIASEIMMRCYSASYGSLALTDFSGRQTPKSNERNWIHLLINIVRQGIRAGVVSSSNKIKIVTFNYDQILERVLQDQFANTELVHGDYEEFIEIHHVHGKLGPLTDSLIRPPSTCLEWARGIHVVNENDVSEEVKATRVAAAELIKSAREIYVCGFAFSGPNCRLLKFNQGLPNHNKRLISYCNYDGNVGVKNAAERLLKFSRPRATQGETVFQEAAGTEARPVSVSDWFKAGYVGELPG